MVAVCCIKGSAYQTQAGCQKGAGGSSWPRALLSCTWAGSFLARAGRQNVICKATAVRSCHAQGRNGGVSPPGRSRGLNLAFFIWWTSGGGSRLSPEGVLALPIARSANEDKKLKSPATLFDSFVRSLEAMETSQVSKLL